MRREGRKRNCKHALHDKGQCGMGTVASTGEPVIPSNGLLEGSKMPVDRKMVRRIARLARIKVSEDDMPRLEGELNSILQWIGMLNEVDTTGVEPMTSVVKMSMKMRDDLVTDGQDPRAVTANAPKSEDDFYVVPKVVE
jgi:aspartyl-tRNA(Asn)/glutamyl-tRNA(Gln) amidotransferase subunit C